jgi:hypothetical protein
MTLGSVSASWVVNNQVSLIATLRNVLGLNVKEELVITSVRAAVGAGSRRGRALQEATTTGAEVEFVIGVADQGRALISEGKITELAAGSEEMAQRFAAQLDVELTARGQEAINLPPGALAFEGPTTVEVRPQQESVAATEAKTSSAGDSINNIENTDGQQAAAQPSDDGNGNIVLIIIIALLVGFGFGVYQRASNVGEKSSASQQQTADGAEYGSKIAHLDAAFEFETDEEPPSPQQFQH